VAQTQVSFRNPGNGTQLLCPIPRISGNYFCLPPVDIQLWGKSFNQSGYISSETIVACVSILAGLEILQLGFESISSSPGNRRPPPLTRSALPTLTSFSFDGVSEYLEDPLNRIDAPQLNRLSVTFNQIVFDTPQLIQLICLTPGLKAPILPSWIMPFELNFHQINMPTECSTRGFCAVSWIGDFRLSSRSLPRPCLYFPRCVYDLYIYEIRFSLPDLRDDFENNQWLDVLSP
jgi:hypothetical protein